MHPDRIEENMENFNPFGSIPSRLMKHFQTTLIGCRIWRVMKFLVAL
jgi:hypothetical protein